MIKIKITSYKLNGEYHDSMDAYVDKKLKTDDREFYMTILENCIYRGGLVVVEGTDLDEQSHQYRRLFRYDDLIKAI